MKRLLIAMVVLTTLTGCVSKYKPLSYEAPPAKIERNAAFYVMLPSDGQYDGTPYPGSGLATSNAVVTALTLHTSNIYAAKSVDSLDDAMAKARAAKASYVIQTDILNWEDRATEWSGIPDKIALQFVVYDTMSSKKIASASSKASSKWATFGGDHPQDLLPVPTQTFVDSLF